MNSIEFRTYDGSTLAEFNNHGSGFVGTVKGYSGLCRASSLDGVISSVLRRNDPTTFDLIEVDGKQFHMSTLLGGLLASEIRGSMTEAGK